MGFRYIGSKTRIANEILEQISEIAKPGAQVTDLMCGTGSISVALRQQGYRVIANDVMTFAYHHARILLLFTSPPQFDRATEFIHQFYPKEKQELFPLSSYEQIIKSLNAVPARKGYFWNEFCMEGKPKNTEKSRNYFSPKNAKKIDSLRWWIKNLYEEKKISDLEHSLLIHDLIMAANDIANIAGTYGHYLSKLIGRSKGPIELKPTPLFFMDDRGKHKVLRKYAEEIAGEIKCDLCYIDPPYKKRQYAANYHILETLAREDEPEAIGVSGLRPWRDQYSNFCTKTRIQDSFRKIFSEMQCPHFLISYSEDGLLSAEQLENLFKEFGKVKIRTLLNKRFKSNKSNLQPFLTEYLFHLEVQ